MARHRLNPAPSPTPWSSSGTPPRAMPVSRTAASVSPTPSARSRMTTALSVEDRRRDYAEDRCRLLGTIEGSGVRGDLHDARIRRAYNFRPQGQREGDSGI